MTWCFTGLLQLVYFVLEHAHSVAGTSAFKRSLMNALKSFFVMPFIPLVLGLLGNYLMQPLRGSISN
jgi:ACR3 family arsenite efflux pump ArsB